jgi:hypothetical protein
MTGTPTEVPVPKNVMWLSWGGTCFAKRGD